jgi:hypothetical protein
MKYERDRVGFVTVTVYLQKVGVRVNGLILFKKAGAAFNLHNLLRCLKTDVTFVLHPFLFLCRWGLQIHPNQVFDFA